MNNKKLIGVAAVLIGILLFGIACVYFAEPAKALPSFMPGFDPTEVKHHFKHGIGALFLALGCFALAWFQTGTKKSSSASATPEK